MAKPIIRGKRFKPFPKPIVRIEEKQHSIILSHLINVAPAQNNKRDHAKLHKNSIGSFYNMYLKKGTLL